MARGHLLFSQALEGSDRLATSPLQPPYVPNAHKKR